MFCNTAGNIPHRAGMVGGRGDDLKKLPESFLDRKAKEPRRQYLERSSQRKCLPTTYQFTCSPSLTFPHKLSPAHLWVSLTGSSSRGIDVTSNGNHFHRSQLEVGNRNEAATEHSEEQTPLGVASVVLCARLRSPACYQGLAGAERLIAGLGDVFPITRRTVLQRTLSGLGCPPA